MRQRPGSQAPHALENSDALVLFRCVTDYYDYYAVGIVATDKQLQANVRTIFLPASRKTAEKSRGQSLRKPSSEPVAQNEEVTLMLLMAIAGPRTHTYNLMV